MCLLGATQSSGLGGFSWGQLEEGLDAGLEFFCGERLFQVVVEAMFFEIVCFVIINESRNRHDPRAFCFGSSLDAFAYHSPVHVGQVNIEYDDMRVRFDN